MMLQKVVDHFIYDYNHNRPIFWLELIGMISGVVASLILVFMGAASPFLLVFVLFAICSFTLAIAGYLRKSSFLLFLNSIYTIIDLIGIWNNI